jgi:small subunit ribosomal protein S1
LVHLSELSWTRVGRASDVVEVGQEVDVLIIGVDRERKKIALSLRRAQPEPWADAASKYLPGQIVEGTITRLTTFGAFARIEDGIEGLIHISELDEGHVANPRHVVQEGEVRPMRILRIEPERRRLGLSLRGIPRGDEPDASAYAAHRQDDAGPTIGDAFGGWTDQEDER